MKGEFSWLVLVAAFAVVAGLCGILTARLARVGSSAEPSSPGDGRSAAQVTEPPR